MRGEPARWWMRAAAFVVAVLVAGAPACFGHEFGPARVDVRLQRDGRISLAIELFPDHLPAGLRPPSDPRQLTAYVRRFIEAASLSVDGGTACELEPAQAATGPVAGTDATAFVITAAATMPAPSRTVAWMHRWPLPTHLVRIGREGEPETMSYWIDGGASTPPFPIHGAMVVAPSRTEVIGEFLALGFTHIVPRGADHILFVLGLFLLGQRWRPLLKQVTAFTLAHSITLALAMHEVVRVPPSIVEPLIAVSIVFVAVENLLVRRVRPTRVALVFCFGLLHGLGFAGVLRGFDLPRHEFWIGLASFNVGVELGQLAVIAAAFATVGWWARQAPWYRARVTIPASLAIAATGAFWSIQRLG